MNVRNPSTRLAMVVGLTVVVLVVAAAVVNATRPVQQFERDTPEGTVQAFLLAVSEEDYDTAHALLSAELATECEPSELIQDFEYSRIAVTDVIEAGDEIEVEVEVTVVETGSDFEPYRYQNRMSFTLIDEGGLLMIDRLPYNYYCREN